MNTFMINNNFHCLIFLLCNTKNTTKYYKKTKKTKIFNKKYYKILHFDYKKNEFFQNIFYELYFIM